jgi:hypothetical protein
VNSAAINMGVQAGTHLLKEGKKDRQKKKNKGKESTLKIILRLTYEEIYGIHIT